MRRPLSEIPQDRALDWVASVHAASEATMKGLGDDERQSFESRTRRAIARCGCGPGRIRSRGYSVPDVGRSNLDDSSIYDVRTLPHGQGSEARTHFYAERVTEYFESEYADVETPPSDIIHVTCTGYASPSGAQRLIATKRWGDRTRVTHAYHMGCYASLPATRLAAGALLSRPKSDGAGERRPVDIVHTELCSLHLDPTDHSLEQLLVHSLFGDGFIRYSLRDDDGRPGLRLVAEREYVIPDSAELMTWIASDAGMKMTLARDVPDRIAAYLIPFVESLAADGDRTLDDLRANAVFAVHPGGPRIVDRVRDVLGLGEPSVELSRGVLLDYGNMSSATLPHVWMRVLADEGTPAGTPVVSLAFGPGLTVCGALFEKVG
jgi:predicted naringenin-chalcone synthase